MPFGAMMASTINTCHVHYLKVVTGWECTPPI
jgi:hypothetical protein